MKENKNIQSVTEWRDWGTGGDFKEPFTLDIKMNDGKRIFIDNIQSVFLSPPFSILLIGESAFKIRGEPIADGTGSITGGRSLPFSLINQICKVKINSVDDIVKNYDEIYEFVNSCTKLSDIKDSIEITQEKDNFRSIELIKKTKTIVDESNKYNWFILTISLNEFPNYYLFKDINEGYENSRSKVHERLWPPSG
ncbi:hypothetical protein FACS1894130_12210 [Spirochaetia bacterium]|nr:hypothetical protein FACS1894130_12210 [Spirochaetia bacterium]